MQNWGFKGLGALANSPVLKGTFIGGSSGGISGYAGGFAATFALTGGDISKAHEAGMQGAKLGLIIGGAAGGYTAFRTAKTNHVDPWNGKWDFPENDGALGEWSNKTLQKGEIIDRYGRLEGEYFSPQGTPLENRSLHPFSNTENYNSFEVVKPFNVKTSVVAPYYGLPGMGTQYITPFKTSVLINKGFIVPIK